MVQTQVGCLGPLYVKNILQITATEMHINLRHTVVLLVIKQQNSSTQWLFEGVWIVSHDSMENSFYLICFHNNTERKTQKI